MTVKEIAEKAQCSVSWVYAIAKEIGRVPTPDEIMKKKGKRGRPTKYTANSIKGDN